MNTPDAPLTGEERAAIYARYEAAYAMVCALDAGTAQWFMSIPARPTVDPDLVIGTSLLDVPRLLSEIARLQAALDRAARTVVAALAEEIPP